MTNWKNRYKLYWLLKMGLWEQIEISLEEGYKLEQFNDRTLRVYNGRTLVGGIYFGTIIF